MAYNNLNSITQNYNYLEPDDKEAGTTMNLFALALTIALFLYPELTKFVTC